MERFRESQHVRPLRVAEIGQWFLRKVESVSYVKGVSLRDEEDVSCGGRGGLDAEIDLRRCLQEKGFAHLESDEIRVPSDLLPALYDLEKAYERLPLDSQCPQQNRFRRHSRYILLPWELYLSQRPTVDYFQKRDLNPVDGGVVRRFENLEPETASNPFLLALIDFDFMGTSFSDEDLSFPMDLGVHLIRIEASPETPQGVARGFRDVLLIDFTPMKPALAG